MSFLSCARGDTFILSSVGVHGQHWVWKANGHLVVAVAVVLGERSQGGMVVPKGGRVDERRWEFVGRDVLGMDGGGR